MFPFDLSSIMGGVTPQELIETLGKFMKESLKKSNDIEARLTRIEILLTNIKEKENVCN